MFHIIKHQSGKNKGKFDISFIVRGKFIFGSNQGYENITDAYKAIFSAAKHFQSQSFEVQDNVKNSIFSFYRTDSKSFGVYVSKKKLAKLPQHDSKSELPNHAKR